MKYLLILLSLVVLGCEQETTTSTGEASMAYAYVNHTSTPVTENEECYYVSSGLFVEQPALIFRNNVIEGHLGWNLVPNAYLVDETEQLASCLVDVALLDGELLIRIKPDSLWDVEILITSLALQEPS
jgi:hypothetical protein